MFKNKARLFGLLQSRGYSIVDQENKGDFVKEYWRAGAYDRTVVVEYHETVPAFVYVEASKKGTEAERLQDLEDILSMKRLNVQPPTFTYSAMVWLGAIMGRNDDPGEDDEYVPCRVEAENPEDGLCDVRTESGGRYIVKADSIRRLPCPRVLQR